MISSGSGSGPRPEGWTEGPCKQEALKSLSGTSVFFTWTPEQEESRHLGSAVVWDCRKGTSLKLPSFPRLHAYHEINRSGKKTRLPKPLTSASARGDLGYEENCSLPPRSHFINKRQSCGLIMELQSPRSVWICIIIATQKSNLTLPLLHLVYVFLSNQKYFDICF